MYLNPQIFGVHHVHNQNTCHPNMYACSDVDFLCNMAYCASRLYSSQQWRVSSICNNYIDLSMSQCLAYYFRSNSHISFPSNLEELKQMSAVLRFYSIHHPLYCLVLFSSAYIFKQSFAIPGSVFLVCSFIEWILFLKINFLHYIVL